MFPNERTKRKTKGKVRGDTLWRFPNVGHLGRKGLGDEGRSPHTNCHAATIYAENAGVQYFGSSTTFESELGVDHDIVLISGTA